MVFWVATALIAWLLLGGLQALRRRLRRAQGACVACGYQMATPGYPGLFIKYEARRKLRQRRALTATGAP
ncbi:MAG: hypothetical protein SGJ11_04345 [Phycisphaerae bacterium]|nr:hypothetical protein [Phycisphaerae bacterium]